MIPDASIRPHHLDGAKRIDLLCGVASILLGVSLALAPGDGIVVMAWIIGGFSVLSSFVLFFVAKRLRKLKSAKPTTVADAFNHSRHPAAQ